MWITLFSIVIGIALGLAMGAVVMESDEKDLANTGAVRRGVSGSFVIHSF